MRYKDVNGIAYNLIDVYDWRNPLTVASIPEKIEIDLISGELNIFKEDDVARILKDKRAWFLGRIKTLNGNIEDFSEARIVASKSKQKIIMVYKGKKFEREREYESMFEGKNKDCDKKD